MAALIEPQHLLPQGPFGSVAGIRSRHFGEEEDIHRVAAGCGFFALKIISQNPTYWQSRISYPSARRRSEEHTSELQSLAYLVCRLLLEKKKIKCSESTRPITPI